MEPARQQWRICLGYCSEPTITELNGFEFFKYAHGKAAINSELPMTTAATARTFSLVNVQTMDREGSRF
jgi:hypothetical protein